VTDKGEEAMRRLDKAIEGMVKMGLKKIQVLLVPGSILGRPGATMR
jgi:hypothetical protein